jgi:hypothetical protein
MDYYDHWFDREGVAFHRMSRTRLSRNDALLKLTNDMGIQVPTFNLIRNLYEFKLLEPDEEVVVYIDEYAHASEGKEKMLLSEAYSRYPDRVASIYLRRRSGKPMSLRYLRIGPDDIWWLEYWSDDEWRSNYGNVKIVIADDYTIRACKFHDPRETPLLAIDFIESRDGLWAAIDYNTSPGLRHTPIEETVSGIEIVSKIKKWFER